MDYLKNIRKTLHEKLFPKNSCLDGLESLKEYKERRISILIIYFTMFLISLGFSVILTGVWPYLDKLDPTAGKEFMGYIVAANPLAQMIFSPIFGWWSNKIGSIRIPVLASMVLFAIGNAVYSLLDVFEDNRKYWMLLTRFLVGISSASVAACRSYLSAATKLSERTHAVSMISLAQVLGFTFGPALQAAVVPLGNEGVWIVEKKLKLNMYTAAGWINVLLAVINFVMFLPAIFKEKKIATKEAMQRQGVESEKDTYKGKKTDYLSVWTLIVAFFVLVFNFMLLETLGTSLTMDQFAWTKAEALYYMGILMSVGALIAIITFGFTPLLCRYFSEVKILIWGGFLFMVLGRAVHIPWGTEPALVYNDTIKLELLENCQKLNSNVIDNFISNNLFSSKEASHFNNNNLRLENNISNGNSSVNYNILYEDFNHSLLHKNNSEVNNICDNIPEMVGCPSSQEWCLTTPGMTLTQFLVGYVLTVIGYPVGVTLIQTIFSKILGTRPQGLWMGWMTGSGCLSRVLGPVFVTYIYTEFGTIWTFGMTTVMMILSIIWLLCFKNRLVTEDQTKERPEDVEMQDIKLMEPEIANGSKS